MTAPGTYLRTIWHLDPEQVLYRLRLRSQKVALSRLPALGRHLTRPIPDRWGWPEDFVPIDGRMPIDPLAAEAISSGRFALLNQERHLGEPQDWQQKGADQLWRYHLHYFEWMWHLAGHHDRVWAVDVFDRLFRSWQATNPVGRWDAWSPYVASLRAWTLCGVHRQLAAGQPIDSVVVESIALHAGYLRVHLERDVGGNHLVKNLKALLGVAVFLDDRPLALRSQRLLEEQVAIQILSDGGHYERSPSYHAQVLGDLLDCRDLLARVGQELNGATTESITMMQHWLGAMLSPDGEVARFNDCTKVGQPRLAVLGPLAGQPAPIVHLEPSGYIVGRPDDRMHFVLDVGPPCPPNLPAHAHADTLSFELAIDGHRTIVDTGTSTYQIVHLRHHERSTAAHNTVEVDGQDSTEVWGLFRAGRRAGVNVRTCVESQGTVEVDASHDGYRHLRGAPTVRRQVRASPGSFRVTDTVEGAGSHRLTSRLHLAPGVHPRQLGPGRFRVDAATIWSSRPGHLQTTSIASDFGNSEPATCIVFDLSGDLPQALTFGVDLDSAG